jgi:hypothetical protein
MFPNETLMKPETWDAILGSMIAVRDAHGWRGSEHLEELEPRFLALCKSLLDRGDQELAWTCTLIVTAEQ